MSRASLQYVEDFFEAAFGSAELEQLFCFQKTGGPMNVLRGTPGGLYPSLKRYNEDGYNTYFTVNRVDGTRRLAKDVIDVRALFIDADGVEPELDEFPLPPNIKVSSKNGPHYYWLPRTPVPKEYFTKFQKRLAKKFGTDPKVSDLPRLMRVPGLDHVKDPTSPYFVEYEILHTNRYSLEELLTALPDDPQDDEPPTKKAKKKFSTKTFEEFKTALPTEEGSRNAALYDLCAEGLGSDLSIDQIRSDVQDYCERSGLPTEEGLSVLRSAVKRHIEQPFVSFLDSSEEFTLEDIAKKFLSSEFNQDFNRNLVVYRGSQYEYVDGRYQSIPKYLFENRVQRFLQTHGLCQTIRFRNDVIANINALAQPAHVEEIPFFLDHRATTDSFVALKDGLASIDKLMAGEIAISPATMSYFNLARVPHHLDDVSSCTTWNMFLREMIPDGDTRSLIQEWFGYNLLPSSRFQKFLILAGPGANGKSVICLVLELVLGEENCSHLSLEVFNEGKSFSLAELEGKLANIASEIDSGSKASEGTLKKIAAGDPFMADRKFRDPFKLLPTAKMTFATNDTPTFRDRSEGIWRRLILVPMLKVKEESEQDRRLVDRNFWKNSGELPAILSWSIDGLARLLRNGEFTKPSQIAAAITEHRIESNMERLFLEDHLVESPGSRIFDHETFPAFDEWCKERGFKSSNVQALNKEIKRKFPNAVRVNGPRVSAGRRSRYWENLRLESTRSTALSLSSAKGNKEPSKAEIESSSKEDQNERAARAPTVGL